MRDACSSLRGRHDLYWIFASGHGLYFVFDFQKGIWSANGLTVQDVEEGLMGAVIRSSDKGLRQIVLANFGVRDYIFVVPISTLGFGILSAQLYSRTNQHNRCPWCCLRA